MTKRKAAFASALAAVLVGALPAAAAPAQIAAAADAVETPYGETRGWRVITGSLGGQPAYCAGETGQSETGQSETGAGDTRLRLGFDGAVWQLAAPYAPAPVWDGAYEVDGARFDASGTASDGWSFLTLDAEGLARIRNGSMLVLDIARASVDRPLTGTAAAITKIEECHQRTVRAAAPSAPEAPPAAAACAGDAPPLPGTGLCPDEARALLRFTPEEPMWLPEHCTWAVNETAIVDDVLLYLAADCAGRRSRLEFAGGAHYAELTVVESAFAEGAYTPGEVPLVRFAPADPADPAGSVLSRTLAAIETPAEAGTCRAVPGSEFGFAADSFVVDIAPEVAAKAPQDEPRDACGPFGLKGDSAAFWRVFQGHAWYFDLGQDAYQDVNTDSFTLIVSDGAGGWKAAP